MLTTDQWADYLIYTNPQQKVFVDGRSDFYGPEIGNDYIRLMNGQWDWATSSWRNTGFNRRYCLSKAAFAAPEAESGLARGGGRR